MKNNNNNINTLNKQIVNRQKIKENTIKENTSNESLNKLNKPCNDKNEKSKTNEHFNRFTVFNAVDNFKSNVVDFIQTLLFITVPLVLLICVLILANAQELYFWEIIAAIGIYALTFELLFKKLQTLSNYEKYFEKKNANFNNLSKSDEKRLLRDEEVRYIRNKKQRRKQQEKKEKEEMLIKNEDKINNSNNSLKSKIKSVFDK